MNEITGAMLMRVLRGFSFLLSAVFVALAVPVGLGQTAKVPDWQTAAGGKMAFDVASIRLSKPGTFTPPSFALNAEDGFVPTGGLFSADFPLEVYIEFAYKVWLSPEESKALRATLPKWAVTDHFTIQARAVGSPTKDQMRLMVQSLLADRFKFAFHFEKQQIAVLGLTLVKPGKMGPKLIAHVDGPPCDAHADPLDKTPWKEGDVFPPYCNGTVLRQTNHHQYLLGARDTPMRLVAASLGSLGRQGRPLVDKTGLNGTVDFTMEWLPESSPGATPPADAEGPTFLEAMQEQLGLKLEPMKVEMDVLVVDHVEEPSEN
jgi:bla regulator protein blaR1